MPATPTIQTPPPRRIYGFSGKDTDSIGQPAATVRVLAVPPPPVPGPFDTPPPRTEPSRVGGAFGQSTTLSALSMPTMPRIGERFQGFLLVEELGRGSFARVYRAKQESLAGRDVALKITLRATREPERLARLQHTNIVPVYSIHSTAPVQVICMPFLGRTTIADKILGYRQSYYSARQSTRNAAATRKGSTSLAGSSLAATASRGSTLPPLAASSSVVEDEQRLIGDIGGVLKILVQLADGLDHAHRRGILHLDLKPANVLLADSGEPMLLDFNLAYDTADPSRELVGGTIPYMAPEQIIDLRSRGRGGVDARTDLYSLGVLAYEMLTGQAPFPANARNLADYDRMIELRKQGPPPLREANPALTPAVESIIRKLLAPDPVDRYQSAADLRDDLQRQLTDRPLRYAANRSIPERIGKWRRRNPRAIAVICVACAIALAGGFGSLAYFKSESLAASQAEQRIQRTRQVLDTARVDLAVGGDLLADGATARRRGQQQALNILHEYGLPDDSNWQNGSSFRAIPKDTRAKVAGDLGELLLLLAHSKWIEVRHSTQEARHAVAIEVLRLSQLAEECFKETTPPPFLRAQRSQIVEALSGQPISEDPGEAKTARDHFLNGVHSIAEQDFASAVTSLKAAIELQPNHAAAQLCLAICWQYRGEYLRAIERYEAASVLMPGDPRPHFFVGQSYGHLGKHEEAERAFTRSLDLDPTQTEAYRCRAGARCMLQKFEGAEQDATEGIERHGSPAQLYSLRAKIRQERGNFVGAASDRATADRTQPQTELEYLTRGWSLLPEHPNEALADFQSATRLNPTSIKALRQELHVLADVLDRNRDAVKVADSLLKLSPQDSAVRAHKALIHARLGERKAAHELAQMVLGSTRDPRVLFRLGQVYAVTSAAHPEDRQRAVKILNQAFLAGLHDYRAFENQKELESLRGTREFEEFLARTRASLQ